MPVVFRPALSNTSCNLRMAEDTLPIQTPVTVIYNELVNADVEHIMLIGFGNLIQT